MSPNRKESCEDQVLLVIRGDAKHSKKVDLDAIVVELMKEDCSERGLSEAAMKKPSARTMNNYDALASLDPAVSLSSSSKLKNEARVTSATSLRNLASHIAVVGATHFVPPTSDMPALNPGIEEDALYFNRLVSGVFGCEVVPRVLGTSTDDTSIWATLGTKDDYTKFQLVRMSREAAQHKERGNYSLFHVGKSSVCTGFLPR